MSEIRTLRALGMLDSGGDLRRWASVELEWGTAEDDREVFRAQMGAGRVEAVPICPSGRTGKHQGLLKIGAEPGRAAALAPPAAIPERHRR